MIIQTVPLVFIRKLKKFSSDPLIDLLYRMPTPMLENVTAFVAQTA